MNIREAKNEIKNTLLAYHRKDENGRYRYPLIRQRPILLMGPPGIGKTAIMEQVARECGVGLVAYTITHHTRQSAIGLPRIVDRSYERENFPVTEYTMSEIIASVYDCMERTGKKEGILFIDEINCVSETLAPTMLQFLQNKTFGSHKVPEGWMIVAAGNPPEYNKSVREFDIVTLDRVREIRITADLDTWLEYAWEKKVHGAILSYLNIKKDHFYVVENRADEKVFVTARGWEDLSEILKSYEELGVEIKEDLVSQFLQKEKIAREFAAYYRLYEKYGTDYGITGLLQGRLPAADYEKKVTMAKEASFEERFTVVGLLLEGLQTAFAEYKETDRRMVLLHEALKNLMGYMKDQKSMEGFSDYIENRRERLEVKRQMELISWEEAGTEEKVLRILEKYAAFLKSDHILEKETGLERIKKLFGQQVEDRSCLISEVKEKLERAFRFAADCFGEEQEMILLVSGLTKNGNAMEFIGANGCDSYFRYSEQLLCRRPEQELQEACRRALEEKK